MYRARDLRLHREVAIKFLPSELPSGSEERERLKREARTLVRADPASDLTSPPASAPHRRRADDGRFVLAHLGSPVRPKSRRACTCTRSFCTTHGGGHERAPARRNRSWIAKVGRIRASDADGLLGVFRNHRDWPTRYIGHKSSIQILIRSRGFLVSLVIPIRWSALRSGARGSIATTRAARVTGRRGRTSRCPRLAARRRRRSTPRRSRASPGRTPVKSSPCLPAWV